MKLLCALCFAIMLAAAANALDREAFTFVRYDLNVRVEPQQQRLGVRGKLTLRNDSGSPQRNVSLQISSSLNWRAITQQGKAVQFLTQPYTSDIDHTGSLSEAIVSLAQDVPARGEVELEIGYEGTIPQDATRLTRIGVPAETARHTDWDQIGKTFTAIRGAGYVAWYPISTEAANLSQGNSVAETVARWKTKQAQAEMKIRISDARGSSEASGELTCNAEAGQVNVNHSGGAASAVTECDYLPLEATVPLFVIGKYESLEGTAADVSYLSGHKAVAAEYAHAAEKALPFVTEWMAEPHQKVEVLELPDAGASPYEAGSMLLTPLNHVGTAAMEMTAVHQLAHAAFYSPRPWIYEGVAHFMQAAYRERQSGRQAGLDFMESHRAALLETEKSLAGEKGEQSLSKTEIEDLYRSKAMYVWWMLRDLVGETALKGALAAYQPDQDREPVYCERVIEGEAQVGLRWFFEDWVYHDKGLPDFRVESIFPQQAPSGSYLVTVTIENLGNAGAEVPVRLRAQGGDSSQRLEVRGKAKNSIRFTMPSPPLEIVVNDGSVPESDVSNNIYNVGAEAGKR